MHYTGVIEIIILLELAKNFSPFIKKHFTIKEKNMCIITFFICLLIDAFPAFQYSAFPFEYYFVSDNGNIRSRTIYLMLTSSIAGSSIGSLFQVVVFVLRDVLTLFFGIALNIFHFYKIKRYANKKAPKLKLRPVSVLTNSTAVETKKPKKTENLTNMMIILCLISIFVRIVSLTCGIYWIFTYSILGMILGVSMDSLVTLNSAIPFFVFYKFNKIFRTRFKEIFRKKTI